MKYGLLAIAILLTALVIPTSTHALKYGSGSYGTCQYSSCNISLASSGTVAADVTPNGTSTTCTTASDTVTVTTGASTGYTLTINDTDTTNTLASTNGHSFSASNGSNANPAALATNSWGYRVDGIGGFGAGPTSATSSGTVPSVTFAAIPLSSATGDTIATQSTSASSGVSTSVWYGVCADTTMPNGSYSDSIIYTAVTN